MTVQDMILTAAEARVRVAGYNGFSFRDIARDTGLTNAGVHHHFPTKADLVSRVAEVYTSRFVDALKDSPLEERVGRLRDLFSESLRQDGKMCLCGLLSSESAGLPSPVVHQLKAFFNALTHLLEESLAGAPDPKGKALSVLAQLEGAALLATVFSEPDLLEQATRDLTHV